MYVFAAWERHRPMICTPLYGVPLAIALVAPPILKLILNRIGIYGEVRYHYIIRITYFIVTDNWCYFF